MGVPGGITSSLEVRKAVVNGQEAIQIIKRSWLITKVGEPEPPLIVPGGFYYLIKQ